MRGEPPFIFTNLHAGQGLDRVIEWLEKAVPLRVHRHYVVRRPCRLCSPTVDPLRGRACRAARPAVHTAEPADHSGLVPLFQPWHLFPPMYLDSSGLLLPLSSIHPADSWQAITF